MLKRRRILVDEQAATTPEYVIILAVIVTAVIGFGASLGGMFQDRVQLGTLAGPGTTSSKVVTPDAQPKALAASPADGFSEFPTWIPILIAGQSLLALALAFLFLRRKKAARAQVIAQREETLDKQIKAVLMALRNKNATGVRWDARVVHFMSADLAKVGPKASFQETQDQLLHSGQQAVFVVDKNEELLGLITSVDLDPGAKAASMMQPIDRHFEKSSPVASALRTMVQHGMTVAPVVHNGRLIGVLSYVEAMLGLVATLHVMNEMHARHREMMMRAVGVSAKTVRQRCRANGQVGLWFGRPGRTCRRLRGRHRARFGRPDRPSIATKFRQNCRWSFPAAMDWAASAERSDRQWDVSRPLAREGRSCASAGSGLPVPTCGSAVPCPYSPVIMLPVPCPCYVRCIRWGTTEPHVRRPRGDHRTAASCIDHAVLRA